MKNEPGQPPRDEMFTSSAEDRARNKARRRRYLYIGLTLIGMAFAGLFLTLCSRP